MSGWNDFWDTVLYGDTKKNLDQDYAREMAELKASREYALLWGGLGLGGILLVIVAWKW